MVCVWLENNDIGMGICKGTVVSFVATVTQRLCMRGCVKAGTTTGLT